MMIARKMVAGALLSALACAGCAEDNDKNMMKAAGTPPPAGAPIPNQENFTPPPPGNDPEARKKFEMDRQAKMYQNYPGYNTKGQR